jgi:pilus assembly protein CpaB
MKWAAAGLCLLGVVAALCAAFLLSTLRVSAADAPQLLKSAPETAPDVMMLYATRAVPQMTVLDSTMVATKAVSRDQAPQGFISSPVGVVGKVLAKPVKDGQPFTAALFTEDTGVRQIADVIPKGKRAVGISVTDYAALEGLLSPGSMVDVLVSFKTQSDNSGVGSQPPITLTLLENVQVLAFDQQSVMSAPKTSLLDDPSSHNGGSRRVTLLVDMKQAEALQLAMDQGTLSLALRNPLDAASGGGNSVSMESLMGDRYRHPVAPTPSDDMPKWGKDLAKAIDALKDSHQAAALALPTFWETTVITGDKQETVSFPLADGQTPKAPAAGK